MSTSALFKHIEKVIAEKIPGGLDKIIEKSGFDTRISIENLTIEDIQSIEKYVDENKDILIGKSYGDQNNSSFKFKPGHKTLLLSLPKLLQEYNGNRKTKKKHKERSENQVGVNTEGEDEQLKTELLNKVVKFFQTHNFQLITNINDLISSFVRQNSLIKCFVRCPFCKLIRKIDYKTYGNLSNFQKHCKPHFSNQRVEETNALTEKVAGYSEENVEQLDTILGIEHSTLAG